MQCAHVHDYPHLIYSTVIQVHSISCELLAAINYCHIIGMRIWDSIRQNPKACGKYRVIIFCLR